VSAAKKPKGGRRKAAAEPDVPDRSEAIAHLRAADPVLKKVIDSVDADLGERAGRRGIDPDDHYGALVRSICGQQLSVKAARAIYTRLCGEFGDRPPTPQEILDAEPEPLRAAAGLSRAKVQFLRSLAEHVLSGELELERMDSLPDDEVLAELVAVKGIGEWTAHMFLMFHLDRPDILAVGDLGVRMAIRNEYGLEALPTPAEMRELAEPWHPHASTACRFLWRSLDEPGSAEATPI
jgi:DNA-3-methyladenine glycosylase II